MTNTQEHAPVAVEADGGRWIGLTGEEILACPGLSAGARGVALLAVALDHDLSAEEIASLTGESRVLARRYIAELAGTRYLDWES